MPQLRFLNSFKIFITSDISEQMKILCSSVIKFYYKILYCISGQDFLFCFELMSVNFSLSLPWVMSIALIQFSGLLRYLSQRGTPLKVLAELAFGKCTSGFYFLLFYLVMQTQLRFLVELGSHMEFEFLYKAFKLAALTTQLRLILQ